MEKNFYKNLKLFLKDIVIIFPEDDELIQVITTSINLSILDDDCYTIINDFYNSLHPLEKIILNKDNDIFKKDPIEYWSVTSYEYKLFLKINENWDTFSEHNKHVIWQYIQYLYILSKNICEI